MQIQGDPDGRKSFVLGGVEVTMYFSLADGKVVVEIDTTKEPDEELRVYLNDGDLFGEYPGSESDPIE